MMRRHRRYSITDSETEYSESDFSMMEVPRRQHYRRRSVSRTRLSPSYSNTYLSPVMHEDVRIHRSASTGARGRREKDRERERERMRIIERERDRDIDRDRDRDRERDRERNHERDRDRFVHDRAQPTNVYVDIKNDSRNTSSNKKNHKHQREDIVYLDESEDETVLRRHRIPRPRASTSVSRDASPMPPPRDLELVFDQRLLERNDNRQDFELFRHQQEIERLERELARQREKQEILLLKEEEDRYEDDMSDRLRRLQRYEEQERMEEEKRKAERRYRLQRLEQAEKEAAEQEELREKMRQERLKELQRKIDEEEERERIKKEIRDEEARQRLAEQERRAKEAAMKQAAIEEWKLQEERRRIAEREAQERRDREFRDRLKMEFGYTEEEIEDIINKKHKKDKKEKKEEKEEKKKEKKDDDEKQEKKEKEKEIEERKSPWIKVHHKHLLPETLVAYGLPWDFDPLDGNYLIIKRWISEELQEELFAHTRRLREGKVITETSSTLTELKVNDRRKDKMYLVRKKSPNRRSWIFT